MNDTILVVEDDYANQQVAVLFLKKFGFKTKIAENGEIAIELAQAEEYRLIFMDCQMPIMDGFEATKQIRKNPGLNQNTTIIALTANLLSGVHIECKNCGMDDILNKPISLKTMKAIINKWTDYNIT